MFVEKKTLNLSVFMHIFNFCRNILEWKWKKLNSTKKYLCLAEEGLKVFEKRRRKAKK